MENIELKYEFTNTGGEANIKTPFGIQNFSDIQKIIIEHTDKIIKMLSVYPNGCIIYVEQTAMKAKIRSNWPIEQDRFGDFVIVEPK